MATRTRNTERREDALSRERIVDVAVEMLDSTGENGLTFRGLAARLKTGPGALYWHVANKSELLIAATDSVLIGAVSADLTGETPEDAVRAIALSVLGALEAHPWVGTQLTSVPPPPAVLRIFELLGRQVRALGVPIADQFNSASALQSYILGVAGQNAALARSVDPSTNRAEFIANAAKTWANLDPDDYPFTRAIAGWLRDHDDHAQFLAGIDLILAGITSRWRPPAGELPVPAQPA